ncbi:hypothetical protein Q9233_015728, partial [Columba guinea]
AAPSLTPVHRAGYCAFYGECGRNPEVNVSLVPSNVPCLSNTPAREATGAFLSLLQAVCPDLVQNGSETVLVCCNLAQLSSLRLSVALSGTVLARCPACARNFANLYCHNICSPNQSLFTNVTRVVNHTETGQLAVVEYQCFYGQDYADASFSSCQGVQLPATGGYAIDTMCGRYGARLCTTQHWLDFQGDKNNGLAPLQIDFQLIPNGTDPGDGIVPLAGRAWSCDQAPSASEEPCSCQDCAKSCPLVTAPTAPPPPLQLGRADGALVLGAVLFGIFAFIFIMAVLCRCRRSKKGSMQQPAPAPAKGCSARLGNASHRILSMAFRRWGTLVATHPWPVLAVAAVVAGGLSAGLVTLRLTTDPVELWSSPNSRTRQEKAFYDQHFGPFLRTNQVIVTAPGAPSSGYNSVLFGAKNFSGVLSEPVLQALLELQEQLAATTVQVGDREVTLSDICYAPLNPAAPTLGDCCVNSVTQYFQNNSTRLSATATQNDGDTVGTVDWRDHFIYCSNSPLSFKDITALELSCMAEYGGPVFPYIAVGGYSDSEYTEAEALIITYSLNNFPRDDPRYQWVLGWESRFLEVVGEFQRAHSPNLSVAFMAERSLEDEINRTTGEDIPIFTISYLVVFAYIALALGEYTTCSRILVDSKVTLALGGIAVVLGAVFASMGFLAVLGLPSSLIILEVLLFLFLACGGIYLTLHVSVGLDQELSMPEDSYLLEYFAAMNQYLEVGVPTYFVTTGGYNFSSTNGTNAICSSSGCDPDSLTQTIQYATRFPNVSYLAIPATSWVDDFLDWLNPTGRCCRIHRFGELAGEFCPSTSDDISCMGGQCLNSQRRPTPEEFDQFLPWFLYDRPTLQCAKGGLGAYDTAVSMDANGTILASRFMAYQRPLHTSQEYTGALRAARALAEEITQTLRRVPGTPPEFTVFPYTVTYVYYEQYLTVAAEGASTLALCLIPTFAVSFLLLGMDLRSSAATIITIMMILLDTVGAMNLWDVPYNAVSLINLVAAVGISVEFVSHITCAFAHSTQPGRVARATEATVNMGSKVVSGVAMTNLPGVAVLAFAKAQLIQIFFFRLNLIITLVGLAHGLIFLPVLLSYIGPGLRAPSGDTSGEKGREPAGQDMGLALGNPCFEDKDQGRDKDKATIPQKS